MPTSVKSKNSSTKINRPFDAALLRRAREIISGYQIILHFEDGLYYGRGLELPTAMNHGKTPDACVRATRDILTTAVAYMLESGQTPPAPASENKRTEQINIRLTPEEKMTLEEAARSKGFRGISDYVRSASLATVK
jgi:predicted RNase H-like HicB family nuclease